MVSREYRNEIGLKSATPKVPWPVAIVVLAVGAVGLGFGVMKLRSIPSGNHHAEEAASASSTPAGHGHHGAQSTQGSH